MTPGSTPARHGGRRTRRLMARVAFEDVGKVYPGGARAVDDFDLDVEDGEFMVLVGPSGCGKTTALRMVAGLEHITEGTIRIGDRVVNHVPAKDRDIAMVFQSYALYPHLKVYDNIAFGLRLRKEPKAEIDARVRDAARDARPDRVPRPPPGRAVRRTAPAGRHGAGDRAPAAGLPDGRAALEPRREAAGAGAGRDQPAAVGPGRHDDLRHPRPGRGHDHGRPGRGDAQGAAPAGRLAAGGLRPPGQPVRGRVHRQPVDEHPRGPHRGDRGGALRASSATGASPSGPGSLEARPALSEYAGRARGAGHPPRGASRTRPRARRARRPAPARHGAAARGARLGDRRPRRASRAPCRPSPRTWSSSRRTSGPTSGPPGARPRRRRRAGGAPGARSALQEGERHRAGRGHRRASTSSTRAQGSRSTTNDRDIGEVHDEGGETTYGAGARCGCWR